MSTTQGALKLNVTREAAVVSGARKAEPDPDRVAWVRGLLDGLAGEAKARRARKWDDPSVFINMKDADATEPVPGGAFASIGVIVYPDETAELAITEPERIRGAYRLNLDDAATVIAAG